MALSFHAEVPNTPPGLLSPIAQYAFSPIQSSSATGFGGLKSTRLSPFSPVTPPRPSTSAPPHALLPPALDHRTARRGPIRESSTPAATSGSLTSASTSTAIVALSNSASSHARAIAEVVIVGLVFLLAFLGLSHLSFTPPSPPLWNRRSISGRRLRVRRGSIPSSPSTPSVPVSLFRLESLRVEVVELYMRCLKRDPPVGDCIAPGR